MNTTDQQAVPSTPAPSFTLGYSDALKCLKQQLLIASTTFQALREKETEVQELSRRLDMYGQRFAAQEQQIQNLYSQINVKNKAIESFKNQIACREEDNLILQRRLKRFKKPGKKVGKRK